MYVAYACPCYDSYLGISRVVYKKGVCLDEKYIMKNRK